MTAFVTAPMVTRKKLVLHVAFSARSDIPLSIRTLDVLPQVQHVRGVKQDRGVMYG